MTTTGLPWATLPWRRCRAVLPRGERDPFYGRCELSPGHGDEVEHALEWGMVTVRWSTTARWDGPSA